MSQDDQAALRQAFCDGAALTASPSPVVGNVRHQAEYMWIEFSHLVEGNNREQVIDIIAAELEKLSLSTPVTEAAQEVD